MMKKIILLVLIISSNLIHSQKRMLLTYNDGKVVKGFGKLKQNGVMFKTTEKGKYSKIDSKLIEKGILFLGIGKIKFAFKPHKKNKNPKLMQLLYDGENIKIYTFSPGVFNTSTYLPIGYKSNPNKFIPIKETKLIRYYFSRKNETFATMLRSGAVLGKSFEKRAKEYFKDCTSLFTKLGSEGFKKKDLIAVAKYYEKNCIE